MDEYIETGSIRRGEYAEIIGTLPALGRTAGDIIGAFRAALPEASCAFDGKGRGRALNLDLYGFDAAQNVAVIQIREAARRCASHFMEVRKTYVLAGVNEITGETFRHPVEAAAVRAAIRKAPENPAAAVVGAQRWMWGVTERQLADSLKAGMRQGDVLVVKERAPKAEDIKHDHGATATVGGSHEIRARRIVELLNGRIVALAPSLWHAKNQHAPTFADADGWYSVRVGDVAAAWAFGQKVGD